LCLGQIGECGNSECRICLTLVSLGWNWVIRRHQIGAHTCQRPRCRICSIFITSPTVTINTANGRYTLNSKGTCHTSNVIYILVCKFCDAFYVAETGCALDLRINNHRHFCTINKPVPPVSLHTESHNTNFDLSFLVTVINILPVRPTQSTF